MSVYEPIADLVPGTALPATAPSDAPQPEGRGDIVAQPLSDAAGVSLFEKIGSRDDIAPHELAVVGAALRAYDTSPKKEKTIFQQVAGQTNATTGDLVLMLFEVPQGYEGHITNVNVDAPGSTILPSAPYLNAASWAFLAVLPPSTAPASATAGTALAARMGEVAFAPNPALATNPLVPFQWTFNDDEAPVCFGGEAFFYVLVGGSIAGILNKTIRVSYRVNLYSHT